MSRPIIAGQPIPKLDLAEGFQYGCYDMLKSYGGLPEGAASDLTLTDVRMVKDGPCPQYMGLRMHSQGYGLPDAASVGLS